LTVGTLRYLGVTAAACAALPVGIGAGRSRGQPQQVAAAPLSASRRHRTRRLAAILFALARKRDLGNAKVSVMKAPLPLLPVPGATPMAAADEEPAAPIEMHFVKVANVDERN
jgi:hypothetical protein